MIPKAQSTPLKLVVIKSKTNIYISDNVNNESYFTSRIEDLIFDGEQLEKTYAKSWYKINGIPTKIEKKRPNQRINTRYELKEGYPESELTPKVVEASSFYDEYDAVSGLYTYKYDELEGGLEEIEFEVNVIEELDFGFEITEKRFTPKYDFLSVLSTHPVLLPLKPCKLTHQQSYNIIREHIKNNIDSKYARITSDYDFCFTVKKVITLYQPKQYTVDINAGHKRRKPKYETRFQQSREVEIFEVAPKTYNSYTIVTPFEGDNYDDLVKNIEEYLSELMEKINAPLKECECCKGLGVIVND